MAGEIGKDADEGNDIPGPAPTWNTGGGGFVVEKQVGARVLLSLLSGRPPPSIDVGPIASVRFQSRGDGWILDDLLLSATTGGQTRKFAISVKSGDEFGATVAPREFVRLAWGQLLKTEISFADFNEQHDLLCLACPAPRTELKRHLTELIAKAANQTPDQLERHMQGDEAAEPAVKLYDSFNCPEQFKKGRPESELLPGRLLRILRFWDIDFRDVGSSSVSEAIAICSDVVYDPDPTGEQLWDAICNISDELRPRSGTIDLRGLLDRLRGRFHLRPHPDIRDDLQRLHDHTVNCLVRIRDFLGKDIKLDVADLLESMAQEIAHERAILVYGPSGAIKTSLAKAFAQQVMANNGFAIWIDGSTLNDRGLADIVHLIKLHNSITKVLAEAPFPKPLLVLDGVEKLVRDSAIDEAASLIHAAGQTWNIILTVTSSEAERIQASLIQKRIPIGA
jgi:hypothetical protein